jgi:hypothetical protein
MTSESPEDRALIIPARQVVMGVAGGQVGGKRQKGFVDRLRSHVQLKPPESIR